jgi:hydroxyacylglutathione hydrolase
LDGLSPPTLIVTSWIKPGSNIDLGGRSVRLVSLPGHTPDSVALIDPDSDLVFAGDFIYPDSLFAFLPGADLKAYRDSARRLLSLTGTRTILYGAHGCEDSRAIEAPALARPDLEAMERTLSGVVDGNLKSSPAFFRAASTSTIECGSWRSTSGCTDCRRSQIGNATYGYAKTSDGIRLDTPTPS